MSVSVRRTPKAQATSALGKGKGSEERGTSLFCVLIECKELSLASGEREREKLS